MEDGEWLEVDLDGQSAGSRVQLRRGTGIPGLFVPCEGLSGYLDSDGSIKGQVFCLFEDSQPMSSLESLSWWIGGMGDPHEGRRYYIPTEDGIGVHGLPDSWIRLFLVCEDGRVAEVTRENIAHGFRWLPMEDLPEMDLSPFLAEHRAQNLFSVQLYYGLHPRAEIDHGWGTPAQNWNRQPIQYNDPYGKEIAARRSLPDTLEGLQAPPGIPCWFKIYSARGITIRPAR